jgi:hypothetical protein
MDDQQPTRNAPDDAKEWPVPRCGVSRSEMLRGREAQASTHEMEAIAMEIVQHFKGPKDAYPEIGAIIIAAAPTVFRLQQIYRHAFHPLSLETIGEALICPASTRARQLKDAFGPVIARANREVMRPPRPRKRSINPATKDFVRITNRLGEHLSYRARYDGPQESIDVVLAREQDYRPEHRQAAIAAMLAHLEKNRDMQQRWLADAEKSLQRGKEWVAADGGNHEIRPDADDA